MYYDEDQIKIFNKEMTELIKFLIDKDIPMRLVDNDL